VLPPGGITHRIIEIETRTCFLNQNMIVVVQQIFTW